MKREPLMVGDRVRKRGFQWLGVIVARTPGGWARVTWDDGQMAKERPLFCSHDELEKAT